MKNVLRYLELFFSKTYLHDRFLKLRTLSTFLSVLGGIWLLIKIISYFGIQPENFLKGNMNFFFVFIFIALLSTLYQRRPETEIKEKLKGIDTFIKIKVGNIFEAEQACVIGVNTTFDTNMENDLISTDSLQGQFTQKYYDNCEHLDVDIERELKNISSEDVSGQPAKRGKTKLYPVGTVVKVTPRGRTFYLLAIANINQNGNAECSFRMISDALSELWRFLGEAGDYETELLIPILGTGRGRVTEPREEIIQEIINSFVAASTQKRVCETLSIVIHSRDFYKFSLKMEDLKHYLSAQCRYSRIRRLPGGGVGESQ